MMRPVLAIMAGLLCALLGLRQAHRLREEDRRLRRWEVLLRHLCLLLQEGALPLPEALRQCAREDFPADQALRRLAEDMEHQPLTPLHQLYHGSGAEAPVLLRMLDRLDHGSLESRVQAMRQAGEEIALLAGQAEQKAARDAKMWATLGCTCGACLTLLLL